MTIGINCGHTAGGPGYGAVGYIRESEETRQVGRALMNLFRSAGVDIIDCTIDQADSQQEYLAAAVALANRQELDWFISIHFNASRSHQGKGVEVYTYEGRQYQDALNVCSEISALGFVNRGVKAGSGLYVIRRTKARSMLIEVCFCDNKADVDAYDAAGGPDAMAKAIYRAVYKETVAPTVPVPEENHDLTRDEFHSFVGQIARDDWFERKIVLPSVVVAQAAIESNLGRSELARNANALFGMKQNGWTGRVYVKDAVEQNPDGSYRIDANTLWRAYDSWEQSVDDHNNYIAARKKGSVLRYSSVVGCEDYVQACRGLQSGGYATSLTYAASLISYIERYTLTE